MKAIVRLHQLKKILFSPYLNSKNWDKQGHKYSAPNIIKFYGNLKGLSPDERETLAQTRLDLTQSKCLIIGCGTGREAFELQTLDCPSITAIDTSPEMIKSAKLKNKTNSIEFKHSSIEQIQDSFDLIYITPALTGHIPYKKNRIYFLKEVSQRLKPQGQIFYAPDIMPLKPKNKYYWSSLLLRLRNPRDWESGDTARFQFGALNKTTDHPCYFHFYPSPKESLDELQAVPLEVAYMKNHHYLLNKAPVSRTIVLEKA